MGLSRQMCSTPFSNKQLKCIWGIFSWELSSRMIDCLCLLLRSNWKVFLCLAGSSHQVKSGMIFCAPYLFALRSHWFHKRQRAGTWKGSPQHSGSEQCLPVSFQPLSAMESLNQGAFCWLWKSTVWGQDQVCSQWEEPFRLPQHLAANELGGWFISRAAQYLELVLWLSSPHFLLSPPPTSLPKSRLHSVNCVLVRGLFVLLKTQTKSHLKRQLMLEAVLLSNL